VLSGPEQATLIALIDRLDRNARAIAESLKRGSAA
jgi:hypothetical protein